MLGTKCLFGTRGLYIYSDVSLLPGFSGHSLLRDPRHNKGLSFTEKERDAHYLRGLLPPVVLSQDLQVCCFLLLVCLCTFGS